MATLKTIRKRISAVKSTEKLTRAMKMVAAARLFKAQRRVIEARAFSTETERILNDILKRWGQIGDPLLQPHEKNTAIDLVIFTSDKGLCGTFNEAILKETAYFMAEKNGVNVSLFVLGKKGVSFFNRKKIKPMSEFTMVQDGELQNILTNTMDSLIERYLSGESDEAILAYNSYEGIGRFKPIFKTLLPISFSDAGREYGVDHIYEPALSDVAQWLIRKRLMNSFYLASLESQASELTARMIAMENATRNANDLIQALTTKYNRARQYAITRELIDIIGGVEALK